MELEFSPERVEGGTVIGGFVVQRRLGAGGFGVVLQVVNAAEVALAMKLCKVRLADDRDAVLRFKREMAGLTLLDHPNIVAVHGHGYHPSVDGYPWLVTDLVVGARLDHYVRAIKPSLKQLLSMLAKVFRGVAHMHEHGLVHRDLKPSNIMVRESDHEPVIIDFGLVVIDAGETVTQAHVLAGTPNYLSPEHALWRESEGFLRGERFQSTERVDVYALGVTCFELLTGRRPHEKSKSPMGLSDLLKAKLSVPPTRPDLLNSNVPGPVCDLVLALLAIEPEKRPTAAEAAAQLEELVATAPENWDAPWLVPLAKGPQDGTVAARGQSSRSGGSVVSESAKLPPRPAPALPAELPSLADRADPFAGISVNVPAKAPATPNVVVDSSVARQVPPEAPAAAPAFEEASVAVAPQSFVSLVAAAPPNAAAEKQREDLAELIATAKQLTAVAPQRRGVPGGVWVLAGLVLVVAGFLAFASVTSGGAASTRSPVFTATEPIAPAAAGLVAGPVGPPAARTAPTPEPVPAAAELPTQAPVRERRGRSSVVSAKASPGPQPATQPANAQPANVQPNKTVDLFAGAAPAAAATAVREVPAGLRCNVELQGAVTAGEAPVPVSVIFRKPCFQYGEREVVPEWSTAKGVATSKNGRLFINLTELRIVGASAVPVNADAVQAGVTGVAGTRALRAPKPAGAEAVATAAEVAQTAVLSQLPSEAQQVIRSANSHSPSDAAAVEMVALARGSQFQIQFREVQQ